MLYAQIFSYRKRKQNKALTTTTLGKVKRFSFSFVYIEKENYDIMFVLVSEGFKISSVVYVMQTVLRDYRMFVYI